MSNQPNDTHITPCYGVSADGQPGPLRRIAYRAHCCACGFLGPKRPGYRQAGWDVTRHNQDGCVDRGRWYGP